MYELTVYTVKGVFRKIFETAEEAKAIGKLMVREHNFRASFTVNRRFVG